MGDGTVCSIYSFSLSFYFFYFYFLFLFFIFGIFRRKLHYKTKSHDKNLLFLLLKSMQFRYDIAEEKN